MELRHTWYRGPDGSMRLAPDPRWREMNKHYADVLCMIPRAVMLASKGDKTAQAFLDALPKPKNNK